MKTHTHTKKDFLPAYFRDARCIRYISPLYDYEDDWEDDEGYVHEGDRVCINEDECTNHTALARKVHEENKTESLNPTLSKFVLCQKSFSVESRSCRRSFLWQPDLGVWVSKWFKPTLSL